MSTTSLAHPAHESTPTIERGRELYRERWQDIEFGNGSWLVPSATDANTVYAVRLGSVPICECADDYAYRGAHCLHVVAAALAKAKTSPCSCCGERVPNRFVTEVEEWYELLSWFPGDLLCADCIQAGYWA